MGDLAGVQRAMAHLANALEAEGLVEESWNLGKEAAEIARRLQDEHPRMLLVALINLGYSAIIREMLEDAVRFSEEAVALVGSSMNLPMEPGRGATWRCTHRVGPHRGCRVGAQALAAAIDASIPCSQRIASRLWPVSRHDEGITALPRGCSEHLKLFEN